MYLLDYHLQLLFVFCVGVSRADNQADATEVSSNNKLTSSKSSLNSIQPAPQKTTLIQQHQQQPQYVPQYVLQKQVSQPQQQQQQQQQQQHQHQPAAMYIIAQPGQGPQSPQFQQAVHQLLNYYSSNPQARFQLLQQQGGVPQGFSQQGLSQAGSHQGGLPHGGLPHGGLPHGGLPHGGLPQGYLQQPSLPQQSYQHHGFPTGALHVIPSPQLENPGQYTQQSGQFSHLGQASQQQFAGHSQPIFAVPAGITIPQHVLAQLTQSIQSPQHQAQNAPQQFLSQQFPVQQAAPQHFAQYPQQPQFSFAPQYQAQSQLSNFGTQGQFALKQSEGSPAAQLLSSNEFQGQSDKSQAASSNYSPVYRTAYIKG